MIKIEKCDNGYVLQNDDFFDNDDVNTTIKKVVQTKEIELEEDSTDSPEDNVKKLELLTVQELLWEILNELGIFGSKHDKYRLRVEVVNQRV